MKNSPLLLTLFILFPAAFSVCAQENLRIGHVNFNEILLAMPATDSAQLTLQKETDQLNKILEELQVSYNNLVTNYSKESDQYTAAVKKLKETEILDTQKKINEFRDNASSQLEQLNARLFNPIYDRISKAIEKIGLSKDLLYILDTSKGSVVYTARSSQNLNPLVLSELGIKK